MFYSFISMINALLASGVEFCGEGLVQQSQTLARADKVQDMASKSSNEGEPGGRCWGRVARFQEFKYRCTAAKLERAILSLFTDPPPSHRTSGCGQLFTARLPPKTIQYAGLEGSKYILSCWHLASIAHISIQQCCFSQIPFQYGLLKTKTITNYEVCFTQSTKPILKTN